MKAYPLHWPAGSRRTPAHERVYGSFKVTVHQASRELLREIELIGGINEIVSSNVPIRRDGLPYVDAARRTINDPGVAVYFDWHGTPRVLACDKYDAPWKNIRAISKSIECLRGLEHYGISDVLEKTFTGFMALPAPDAPRNWWEVLDIDPISTSFQIKTAYRVKAKSAHPDNGGNQSQMAELVKARDTALETRPLA